MRLYNAGEQTWRDRPKRKRGNSLNDYFLKVLLNWLIEGDGTGDRNLDARLALRIWDYETTRAKAYEKNKHGEYDLPSQSIGYDIVLKLGALTIAAPTAEAHAVWEPVLSHGPAAHVALQHFFRAYSCVWIKVSTRSHSNTSGGPLQITALQRIGRNLASGSTASAWFATCSASATQAR